MDGGWKKSLNVGGAGNQYRNKISSLLLRSSMVNQQWKQRIISAESEDTVRVNFINDVFPVSNPASYKGTAPRALRTSFIEEWSQKSADEVKKQAEQ